MSTTTHASAVLIGATAVLIRGASGSGKSRLAWALINAQTQGLLRFSRLVGDDRVVLEACNGHLLVRPAPALAGLIEIRGLGIRCLPCEPVAAVGLVVDLEAGDAERLPTPEASRTAISGVILPRLAVAPDADPLLLVVGYLSSGAMTGG
ncbi:MAG TPA: HPr kinase/phosphatase C-terminal domain-containing protein [Pseudolabrys sp.]|nr:HPr kinase/phosphatase C-terminal domain-containing protein [Pseudolabrys sp.]